MSLKISVIGTGYVGLVLAVGLADFGNYVLGVDIDRKKIESLSKGIPTIYEPGLDEYLKRNIDSGKLSFTTNTKDAVRWADVIFIAVGTPPLPDGGADLSQVFSVAEEIAYAMKEVGGYKVIATKSTVPVGTNRRVYGLIREIVQNDNFDVVSNPEFLREGKALYDFFHPDRVVIGTETDRPVEIMKEIYRPLYLTETPFVFTNWETAEMIKYASNAFLATKITFINQIANLCDAVGADVHKVAKAMGMDGRISPKFLHPGPGFGGSCFPKDTRALVRIGEEYGVEMTLVKAVIDANEMQRRIIVQKAERMLGSLEGKVVAVWGLAFKAETDDIRESPAIDVVKGLLAKGAVVRASDPKAINNARRVLGGKVEFYENEYDAVKGADLLVILTEWNQYRNADLDRVASVMRQRKILDARNVLEPAKAKALGFEYQGVGRR